jgi:hypothetical protein
MKFYQLGFRYLQRKKGKTILLLIVLILVNSMILGTSMILRTTNESKQAMQEKTNSKIVAEITSKDSKITENEVNKIGTLEDVSSINRIGRQEVFPNNFAPVTLNTSTNEENLKIALLSYDDLEKDEKKNNYNVFKYHKDVEDFDTFAENILKAYMAGCARVFERLPILANAELLRNIIYSGVWTKFYAARRKKNNTAGKQLEEHNDRSI